MVSFQTLLYKFYYIICSYVYYINNDMIDSFNDIYNKCEKKPLLPYDDGFIFDMTEYDKDLSHFYDTYGNEVLLKLPNETILFYINKYNNTNNIELKHAFFLACKFILNRKSIYEDEKISKSKFDKILMIYNHDDKIKKFIKIMSTVFYDKIKSI